MPRAPHTSHVTLRKLDGTDKVGIRLMTDENGMLLYEWRLAQALAPEVPAEDVSYAEFRPEQELTWTQNDWSGGALQFYHDSSRPNRYALADGVWALTPNELSLGPEVVEVTFGIQNGGAEQNNTNEWSESGVNLSAVATAPYSGHYHFQMSAVSTSDYMEQTLENPTRWRANGVRVSAKVRGSSAGGAIRMQIVETGGSSTPTTSGTAVTLTTSYQAITASVNLQSDTTAIKIRVECSTDSGSDRTVYVDQIQALATDTTDVTAEGMNANSLRMLVTTQGLHCVTASAIYLFVEGTDHWELRKSFGSAITGAEVFDNRIFIGLGESTAYQYSDAGDSTTWTAHDGSGTQDNANYFVKTLNVNNNWALAKTLDDDNMHLSVDPTASAGWGSAIEVGKDDHQIENVYNLGGVAAIAKRDGFYMYQGLGMTNRMVNLYSGAEHFVDANNFSRAVVYGGRLYTTTAEVGLLRLNNVGTGQWEDLTYLIASPGFSDLGDRVRAFGTDGKWLYLLVEDTASVSVTKTCWLLAMREFANNQWQVHTISTVTMSDANDIYVFKPDTNPYIFINGESTTSEAVTYRLRLPDRTDTPRHATNAGLRTSGTLITSYMDWSRPQVEKSIDRYRLISESLSGVLQVTLEYQADDDTSWTVFNASDYTFGTSPQQAIASTSGTTARRIRFRLTLKNSATSFTSSPVIKATVLESNWRPPRLKRWTLVAALEEDVRGTHGVPGELAVKRQINRLTRLRAETSPVKMEDIDGETHICHIIDMAEMQVRTRAASQVSTRYARGLQLAILETKSQSGTFWNDSRWGEFWWG